MRTGQTSPGGSLRSVIPNTLPRVAKPKYCTRASRTHCLERGSTIGEGGDTTISSPGRSPTQPLSGIGLHDPLHGQQACPEFIAFDEGVGQICPGEGLFSCHSIPKCGQICYIPAPPPPIVERLSSVLSSCKPNPFWAALNASVTHQYDARCDIQRDIALVHARRPVSGVDGISYPSPGGDNYARNISVYCPV